MSRVAIRNTAIVAAIAATIFLSESAFSSFAISINQIITILILVGLAVFAYHYFKENQLAWLVLTPGQRQTLIGCAIAFGLLFLFGFPLLGPIITSAGVLVAMILVVALAAAILIRSRRY